MSQIFISYRRADSGLATERIHDRLVQAFKNENVFLDVDNHIPIGSNFPQVLTDTLKNCDVVIAVIGEKWLEIREDDNPNQRRLDNPSDFVRQEIETAINNPSITLIPLLFDKSTMPASKDLPSSLQNLTQRQAIQIRRNPDFHDDMDKLIAVIKAELAKKDEARRLMATQQNAPQLSNNEKIMNLVAKLNLPLQSADFSETRRLSSEQRKKIWKDGYPGILSIVSILALGLFSIWSISEIITEARFSTVEYMCNGIIALTMLMLAVTLVQQVRQILFPRVKQIKGMLVNPRLRYDKTASFEIYRTQFNVEKTSLTSESEISTCLGIVVEATYLQHTFSTTLLNLRLVE